MPYIKSGNRSQLRLIAAGRKPGAPGELNYLFTRIALDYWSGKQNYQAANDIIGALEGAKMEFYRRHVAPYEDTKIRDNGDVPVS